MIRWQNCVLCDAPLRRQYQSGSYLCHPCLVRLADLEREEAIRRIGPNWVQEGTCARCGEPIRDISTHPRYPFWVAGDLRTGLRCQGGAMHHPAPDNPASQ